MAAAGEDGADTGAPDAGGLTVAQLWRWLADGEVTDALLGWAPDISALTGALLERSHAFRFVVSPPDGAVWPPRTDGPFDRSVARAATEWRAAMDNGSGTAPEVVHGYWDTIKEHDATAIADVAQGRPWALCAAVLALHAIADEASAGAAGGGRREGPGLIYRARARELLARSGTVARLPAERVTQLPKSRTTNVGITHRSVSRYGCTTTDGIRVDWQRAPLRRRGSRPVARHANVLLLPWPLRIRESDFVPVPGSVRRPEREPFGFFSYEPSEPLDLDLVDGLIDAALEEVDGVDVIVLPEGALDEGDIAAFEDRLARRDVPMLVTGLRPQPATGAQFPGNGVHVGLLLGDTWWHYRQDKHHRWFLDASQIEAYNIAGALHPRVRWWEAMAIPERCVHILELGGGITVAAVVCEDLARLDGVAQLLRSIGPTLVVTLLLDGPQLASRWTSRYASVLADDPGSAVLTLTALGMAVRSQPGGRPPSRVVALWKDPTRGMREIAMDPGAQGVLLKAVMDRSARHAADGRAPIDDVTDFYIAGVHQLRAAAASPASTGRDDPTRPPVLEPAELTVLSSWAEAVADAIAYAASPVAEVIAAARSDAPWRKAAGLPPMSDTLAGVLDRLVAEAQAAAARANQATVRGVRAELVAAADREDPLAEVVGAALVAALDAVRGG